MHFKKGYRQFHVSARRLFDQRRPQMSHGLKFVLQRKSLFVEVDDHIFACARECVCAYEAHSNFSQTTPKVSLVLPSGADWETAPGSPKALPLSPLSRVCVSVCVCKHTPQVCVCTHKYVYMPGFFSQTASL